MLSYSVSETQLGVRSASRPIETIHHLSPTPEERIGSTPLPREDNDGTDQQSTDMQVSSHAPRFASDSPRGDVIVLYMPSMQYFKSIRRHEGSQQYSEYYTYCQVQTCGHITVNLNTVTYNIYTTCVFHNMLLQPKTVASERARLTVEVSVSRRRRSSRRNETRTKSRIGSTLSSSRSVEGTTGGLSRLTL